MHKIWIVLTGLSLTLLFSTSVFGHSGRTDSSGCHTCRTNCERYGLSYGEYHCHNGGTGSGGSVGSAPVQQVQPVIVYPTNTPTPEPTSIPTSTPTPTKKPITTVTKKSMKTAPKKKINKKVAKPKPVKKTNSFWGWLFK